MKISLYSVTTNMCNAHLLHYYCYAFIKNASIIIAEKDEALDFRFLLAYRQLQSATLAKYAESSCL